MQNCPTFVMDRAPAVPDRMRGNAGDSATARSREAFSLFVWINARERKPSAVDVTPGVPDSMKSWASKCERVASGLPTAWTNAAERSLKYGTIEAKDGCAPKKPSRSSAAPSADPGRGMAIV